MELGSDRYGERLRQLVFYACADAVGHCWLIPVVQYLVKSARGSLEALLAVGFVSGKIC